jgi:hypothetical protein
MQLSCELVQVRSAFGRATDEVIVVGEDRPTFELPAELERKLEERVFKERKTFVSPEVMEFIEGSRRDKVGSLVVNRSGRSVRTRLHT